MESETNRSNNHTLLLGPGPTPDSNNTKAFVDLFDGPVKPAVDTNSAMVDLEEEEEETPEAATADTTQKPPPMFKPPVEQGADQEEEQIGKIEKWNKKELTESLEMFLNFRDMIQSQLLAWYAKNPDAKRYEMDEDQMNYMARVYAPVFRKYGNRIPDWIWILLAEGMILLPLAKQAAADRKIISQNEKTAASPDTAKVLQASTGELPERRHFKIDNRGYYEYDIHGAYVYVKDRTELASLDNLKELVERNGANKIMKVFGLTKSQLPAEEEE